MGGKKKKRSQTGMQSQPLTCSDLYKLFHSYLDLKQFAIQQSCSGARLTRCVRIFDEDIFERLTSLSLTRHLSHTRGISLFGDDDDVLAELSKSADEADKWWRQAEYVCVCVCACKSNS